jgi:aspartate kinase
LIKVMKFGGTSVGSEKALGNLVSIVKNETCQKALVVSAMSGVTNTLIALMRDPKVSNDAFYEELLQRHILASRSMMSPSELNDLEMKLKLRIFGLRQAVDRYLSDSVNRETLQDAISSWGERLSSLMVASILKAQGMDAVAMTSEEAGIAAVGSPGNGAANLEVSERNFRGNVLPLVMAGRIPVLTGYYGTDALGRPLTFGRGGSDYSGSVVANALDAKVVEIWTDVDGFMTADPRIVSSARTIREMNYGEAAELAYFGAKVLHPRTIEPARKKKIVVMVKNTFNPSGEGTKIHDLRTSGNELLRSVAVKSDLSILKVYSSEIVYNPSLVTKLLESVSEDGVTTYAISTSLSTLAIALPSGATKSVCDKIRRLEMGQIEKVKIKDKVSLICTVGDDLINRMGAAAMIFDATMEVNANIEMISEGASDVALNFVVPSEQANAVVMRIHERFIAK